MTMYHSTLANMFLTVLHGIEKEKIGASITTVLSIVAM